MRWLLHFAIWACRSSAHKPDCGLSIRKNGRPYVYGSELWRCSEPGRTLRQWPLRGNAVVGRREEYVRGFAVAKKSADRGPQSLPRTTRARGRPERAEVLAGRAPQILGTWPGVDRTTAKFLYPRKRKCGAPLPIRARGFTANYGQTRNLNAPPGESQGLCVVVSENPVLRELRLGTRPLASRGLVNVRAFVRTTGPLCFGGYLRFQELARFDWPGCSLQRDPNLDCGSTIRLRINVDRSIHQANAFAHAGQAQTLAKRCCFDIETLA